MLRSAARVQRLQIAQSRWPGTAQDPRDRPLGRPNAHGNPGLGQAPAPQLDDPQRPLAVGLGLGLDERSRKLASPSAK